MQKCAVNGYRKKWRSNHTAWKQVDNWDKKRKIQMNTETHERQPLRREAEVEQSIIRSVGRFVAFVLLDDLLHSFGVGHELPIPRFVQQEVGSLVMLCCPHKVSVLASAHVFITLPGEPPLAVMLHQLTSHLVLDVAFLAPMLCWAPIAGSAFHPQSSCVLLVNPCFSTRCFCQRLQSITMGESVNANGDASEMATNFARAQHRHFLSMAGCAHPSFCDNIIWQTVFRCHEYWRGVATSKHFSGRRSEQRAQKDNWFLRGRAIAYLIDEYFRPTGSHYQIQGVISFVQFQIGERRRSGLWFTLGASTTIDKWSSIGRSFERIARLPVGISHPPNADNCGTIQSRNSARRKKLSQTKNVCEITYWANSKEQGFHDLGRNYRAWTRHQRKGTKSLYQMEDRRMFSVESNWVLLLRRILLFSTKACLGKTRGKSGECKIIWPETSYWASEKGWRADILFCTQGEGTDWRDELKKSRALRLEPKLPARGEQNVKYRRVIRHPPVCRNFTSESHCIYGNHCLFRHADGEEKPRKRSKKESIWGTVAVLKHKKVKGCVSQNSDPKKSIIRKAGQTRVNASAGHTVNSQDAPGTKFEFGKPKGQL